MGAVGLPHLILVADDAEIRDVLVLLLADEGYRTVVAVDGVDAVEVARREHPDLILLDYAMPRLGGPGFCRAYRDEGGAAPIVMLTATPPAAAAMVEACGAVAFIAKPFMIDEVLAAVTRHLPAITD